MCLSHVAPELSPGRCRAVSAPACGSAAASVSPGLLCCPEHQSPSSVSPSAGPHGLVCGCHAASWSTPGFESQAPRHGRSHRFTKEGDAVLTRKCSPAAGLESEGEKGAGSGQHGSLSPSHPTHGVETAPTFPTSANASSSLPGKTLYLPSATYKIQSIPLFLGKSFPFTISFPS